MIVIDTRGVLAFRFKLNKSTKKNPAEDAEKAVIIEPDEN